ncbi:RodZ domain-containing protein [Paenibacillus sp. JSM ZJ436]|uniref:RodZ domain-containing protein n=1 Tax=Paenibacillus sp. JSM ZJ436 TaxID=3376190 RepID=UPI0037928A34
MSELGQQLREARLQKGMSLDDVQEITKIRKRYLEAIEAGDYKVLPGSFYVRAFIKTYAEAVGLNPDELMEGHKQDMPKAAPEATMEPVIQKRSSRASSDRNTSWLPTVLMWTFPVLIVAVIVYYAFLANKSDPNEGYTAVPPAQEQPSGEGASGEGGGGEQPAEPSDNGEAGTDNAPVDEEPAEGSGEDAEGNGDGAEDGNSEEEPAEEEPVNVSVTQDRSEGKYTIFKVASPAGAGVPVVITASGKSWVEIYRGYNSQGENLYYGNMNAGDVFTDEMDAQGLYIKSAYSPATVIKVGGQVVTDGKSTSRLFFEPVDAEASGE